MTDVRTIIVNYGLADEIDELLSSGALCPHLVLLVDNDSQPDRLRALARRHGTGLLLLDRNYGFAGAVNRAVATVPPGSHILLLNPDVRLTASALTALVEALAEGDLTGVAPTLVSLDGSVQIASGGPVTLASFSAYFLLLSHLVRGARGIFYTRRQVRAGLPPAWLGMACLLLRDGSFSRFGPVPEDELVYAEDVAWGTLASAAGARFAVIPGIRVTHAQGASGASDRWTGALARLARRRLGPFRGGLATLVMQAGLTARALAGRPRRARREPPLGVLGGRT